MQYLSFWKEKSWEPSLMKIGEWKKGYAWVCVWERESWVVGWIHFFASKPYTLDTPGALFSPSEKNTSNMQIHFLSVSLSLACTLIDTLSHSLSLHLAYILERPDPNIQVDYKMSSRYWNPSRGCRATASTATTTRTTTTTVPCFRAPPKTLLRPFSLP